MTVIESQPIVRKPLAQPPTSADPKAALLARVLDVLDREGLAYCILHGYETIADRVDGDVDILVPHEALPNRLAELLRTAEPQLRARIVQWFADRSHFIVLCARGEDGAPVMLQLHVSTDYDVADRLVYEGNEVLRTRRRHEREFWIPAAHVEFACVLANRIAKGKIEPRHAKQLSKLWAEDRERCAHEMFRFFTSDNARLIADAAESGDWVYVERRLPKMGKEFMRNSVVRQPMSFAARWLGTQGRRVCRWLMPESGLHVVFLGPDGVGKTTVIDGVKERVADAFLEVNYQTFARSLLANKPKPGPHALAPRSAAASLAKAAWWLCCYTLGYYKSIHPTLARGGLAINHRYLIDAIVDPKRYRYSGPPELLWGIWSIAPKPDLIVFLDAPAEVIQQRKQEISAEETKRQRDAYRAMAERLPNAKVVDTSQSPQNSIGEVSELILGLMAARVNRRYRVR